jgi:hypothetical protein
MVLGVSLENEDNEEFVLGLIDAISYATYGS